MAFGLVPVQEDDLNELYAMFNAYWTELEAFDPLAGQGEADQAASIAGHEVDLFGRGELRRDHGPEVQGRVLVDAVRRPGGAVEDAELELVGRRAAVRAGQPEVSPVDLMASTPVEAEEIEALMAR